MKTCSRCQEHKPLNAFTKRSASSDGYSASCTSCLNTMKRVRYAENPLDNFETKLRVAINTKARLKSDLAYRRAWGAWKWAKELGRVPKWVKFSRDILPVYRSVLDTFGEGWVVDHIIPLRGETVSGLHVPNNLQPMPSRDNESKNAAFNDSLLKFYE